jgi:hypothetical protein
MAANQVGTAQVTSKGQGVVDEKQEDLIKMGFRVKLRKRQDYVNRMYNQFVVDLNTNEPKNLGLSPLAHLN